MSHVNCQIPSGLQTCAATSIREVSLLRSSFTLFALYLGMLAYADILHQTILHVVRSTAGGQNAFLVALTNFRQVCILRWVPRFSAYFSGL